MKAKINLQGREIIIGDLDIAVGIKKMTGLMFRKKANALLFSFEFPGNYGIHSYFCNPFLAIWMYRRKIIDYKIIAPNAIVKSEKEFDTLIEVPFNEKYKKIFDFFLEHGKV